MLIADTIKSACLSRSLVDVSSGKSGQPAAASRVDSNTSLSVWSNLYLVWLSLKVGLSATWHEALG